MPSAHYYREQAQLLLTWAIAASDPHHATQLTARAIDLLNKSMTADGSRGIDAIAEFNNDQLRPRLQQQQRQSKDSA
jgi:hypothetical protein